MHCHWGYALDSDLTWEQLATVADHAWSVAPYILHTAVKKANVGKNIFISAQSEGDKYIYDGMKVRKGPLPIENASLFYRTDKNMSFVQVEMIKEGEAFKAIIPGTQVKLSCEEIEYYITMSDKFNISFYPKLAYRTLYGP